MSNIILFGLRGSGKTTVGALVARQLGWPFVDLDEVTAAELGYQSAAQAWKGRGQARFRSAEVYALRTVLRSDNQVVSLGGGTPTAPGADVLLAATRGGKLATLLYLRAEPATLRTRLETTDIGTRPSLTGMGALDEIPLVFRDRDPLYMELADAVIQTDDHTPDEVVELVCLHARSA